MINFIFISLIQGIIFGIFFYIVSRIIIYIDNKKSKKQMDEIFDNFREDVLKSCNKSLQEVTDFACKTANGSLLHLQHQINDLQKEIKDLKEKK